MVPCQNHGRSLLWAVWVTDDAKGEEEQCMQQERPWQIEELLSRLKEIFDIPTGLPSMRNQRLYLYS